MRRRDWPRTEKLYHAALARPPHERRVFLEEAVAATRRSCAR